MGLHRGLHRGTHRHQRWQRVGWRLYRVKPGFVCVLDKEWIALLEAQVRVLKAEADTLKLKAETNGYQARLRARDLVADQALLADLLADLPMTAEGKLHDRALFALVGQDESIDRLLAG